MLTVSLTKDQVAVLIQLMNSVSGLENVKVLLPIYDALREAAAKADEPVAE